MTKIIVEGRIGDKIITETISNYQPNIPEQVATAKNNICKSFEKQGYNRKFVEFNL